MLEGSEAVSASEEEQYFLYLVNIKKEEEVCLLGCLKEMLGKYEVGWV